MIDNGKVKEAPFYVQCNKCGSLNVEVTAYDRCDLELKCKSCGQVLNVGHYNACEYER